MCLVFSPMKVLTGPMMSINEHQVRIPAFIHGDKKEKLVLGETRKVEELVVLDRKGINGYSFGEREEEEDDRSSQSSSIGELSSSFEDEDMGDEVQSKNSDEGLLGSLASLEESLPIKRGLSNFFAGKSKSFASLFEAAGSHAKDLVKPENPYNKRRRILMSYKASWRRASCTSLVTTFPPLLSPELVKEDKEEDEDDDEVEKCGCAFPSDHLPNLRNSFRSPRSHSLSDLQND